MGGGLGATSLGNTKMKNINLLIVVLVLILLQSCSDSTDPIVEDYSNQIVPLNIGHKWEYHNIIYDTSGNIFSEFNTSNTIMADTTIENTKWFYFDKNAVYFSIFSDGYHTFDKYELDSLKNSLVYKYPCNPGDTYSEYLVSKVDTQITVPAGSFKCILYSIRLQTQMEFDYRDIFVKPGIGLVKSVTYSFVDNSPIFIYGVQELLNYKF